MEVFLEDTGIWNGELNKEDAPLPNVGGYHPTDWRPQ